MIRRLQMISASSLRYSLVLLVALLAGAAPTAHAAQVDVFAGGVLGPAGAGWIDKNNPRNTQLCRPHGLAVDRDGSLLIADYCNHRVLAVSPDRRHVEVVVGGLGPGHQIDEDDPLKTHL